MEEHRHRGGGRGRHGGREARWGGPRMRRGDIRTAVLAVLTEGPGHGYDVMQNLEDKTGGAWRPSPGSIYPTLQLLEDEGLVRSTERDGKRVFEITDTGRIESADRIELASAPDCGGGAWASAGRAAGAPSSLGSMASGFGPAGAGSCCVSRDAVAGSFAGGRGWTRLGATCLRSDG